MPKKRYRLGMMSCIVLIALLILVMVCFNILAGFIYPKPHGNSKFYLSDQRREFSVPCYKCPVELDVSVTGGGNATFYLVRGIIDNSTSHIRYSEKWSNYIYENKIRYEKNIDHFYFNGQLDAGKYTLLILRIGESHNGSKPLLVGVASDDVGGDEVLDYTYSSRIVYNKFNVFVLKPLRIYVFIVFIIGEILLVIWLFSFITKMKLADEEVELKPRPVRIKRSVQERKPDISPDWKKDLRGGRRKKRRKDEARRDQGKDVMVKRSHKVGSKTIRPRPADRSSKKKVHMLTELSETALETVPVEDGDELPSGGAHRDDPMSDVLDELKGMVPVAGQVKQVKVTVERSISLDEVIIHKGIDDDGIDDGPEEEGSSGYPGGEQVTIETTRHSLYESSERKESGPAPEHGPDRMDEARSIHEVQKPRKEPPVRKPVSLDYGSGATGTEKKVPKSTRKKNEITRERRNRLERTFSQILVNRQEEKRSTGDSAREDHLKDRMDALLEMIVK